MKRVMCEPSVRAREPNAVDLWAEHRGGGGEAGRFITERNTAPAGKLPLNTNFRHPGPRRVT
jgi:hypothetical protein